MAERARAARAPRGGAKADRVPAGTPTPDVSVATGRLASTRADVVVCFVPEGGRPILPGLTASSRLAKVLSRLMRDQGFKGKRHETLLWHAGGSFPASHYLLAGLGSSGAQRIEMLRESCGAAARRAAALKARRTVIALPPQKTESQWAGAVEAAVEGFSLGSYRMVKYQTGEEAAKAPARGAVLLVPRDALGAARAGLASGRVRASATNFTRDLVNEPAMVLTPSRMADVARRSGREHGLEVKVHDERRLRAMGMGGILGVSAGSAEPPCLIHLTYRPRRRRGRLPKVALVGKGLTFDSGGLSLKTASGMETMKLDKAGASAVLGVMTALPRLRLPVEVHGILAMTENMPGGSAIKPGDVLRTMGGRTIEVLNTDAEGRVVLADALTYAQRLGVERIIDLATLTGACMVALGPVSTGVFGSDQEMVDRLLDSARRAGERMWQLPLYDEYADQLRSEIADIKNTASRYGGAITAALFLKSFVDDKVPWLHLDIAGPAFLESEQGYLRRGATGAGVRTLLTYLQSLASS